MRRSLLDVQVAAGTVMVAVAGLSLGGVFAWGGLGLAVGGAAFYGARVRPRIGQDPASGARTAVSARDVLWADAEKALRTLDRYPADGELSGPVIELARLGRRAVERGRRRPAEPSAARTRQVLCLAAETLTAYSASDSGRRHKRSGRMREVLAQAALTLARDNESDDRGQALCVRLRVLEQELNSMSGKGESSHGNDKQY